jgi:hypothetical protein
MYPYVALDSPTYRENSHANHTWDSPSLQTLCFQGPEGPPALNSHAPLVAREIAGGWTALALTCPLNSATPWPSPLMTADRRALCAAFGLQALTAWKPDARSTLSG